MKRAAYIVYLVILFVVLLALGTTDEDRSAWDDDYGGSSGWHSGGHK